MKYCTKCGSQINDETQKFCANCGVALTNDTYSEANGQTDTTVNDFSNVSHLGENITQPYPMKWFKFLIYFALFFSAFINLVHGLNYITGGIYSVQTNGQVEADLVYGMFGNSLKAIDVLYGILMLGIAALAIVARFSLAKYKKNGPLYFYALCAAPMAGAILYNIAVVVITRVRGVFNATTIIVLVVQIVYLCLNYNYFNKRKSLFCN